MTYKKLTDKEWLEIGNQSKKVKKELYKLMDLSYGKMPVKIADILFRSGKELENFNMKAESRMFEEGSSLSTDVFFGEPAKGSQKVWNDERWD